MDDLRNEIRSAFEREQAPHPPASELRSRTVAAAVAHRGGAPRLQWLGAVAAVLIAALLVAAFLSSQLMRRGGAPAGPTHRQVSVPFRDYGQPPAGVPLVYVLDTNDPAEAVAIDWQGHARGSLTMPMNNGLIQAPDGQLFTYYVGDYTWNQLGFLDRLGRPIGQHQHYIYGMWADDNRHSCALYDNVYTLHWTLVIASADAPQRNVAGFAHDDPTGRSGSHLLACSVAHDRAVVADFDSAGITAVSIVRLSDGTLLARHAYSAGAAQTIIASADGQYVAETTGSSTAVRRVADWHRVGDVKLTGAAAFSGDDSRLLFTGRSTAIADWRAGKTVWHADVQTYPFGGFLARPGKADFALSISVGGGPNLGGCMGPPQPWICHEMAKLLIVAGDGSTIEIPGPFYFPW